MIPGFVIAYKDEEDYIHLYFFPGIDEYDQPIYKDIDLSNCKFRYTKSRYLDNAIDYKFYDKRICKLTCKLLDYKNNENIEILNIK